MPIIGSTLRIAVLMVLCLGAAALPAASQDLIDLYRAERVRVQAREMLAEQGGRLRAAHPPRLPVRSVARFAPEITREEPQPEFPITGIYSVGRLERTWFENRFSDTHWAFLGGDTGSRIDTARTRMIRAHLQARFGDPTRVLTDLERPKEAPVQFEYWFVLNGRIPVKVIDVNGPFERGVVVASDAAYREELAVLRESLLRPVLEETDPVPFADHYYVPEVDSWFLIQFDGQRYHVEPVQRERPPNARPVAPGSADSYPPS